MKRGFDSGFGEARIRRRKVSPRGEEAGDPRGSARPGNKAAEDASRPDDASSPGSSAWL